MAVAALLVGCHTQQNFPGTAHGPASAAVQLQLFEPPSSLFDDRPTLTDLSSLNGEPAGAHGFVRPSLGHFIDDRGSRLRFFGVNLSGIACLPDRDTAVRLARHFRKLGFNAVRLHGLDVPGVLLAEDGQIAPDALAQLDHFTAALKAEGLYFSLELHANGGYAGLAGEAQQRFPRGQVLDRFHTPFLAAQRDFARRLLSHQNAETQLEYRSEPALLYVELNHEDTIFPSSVGDPDELPAEFRAELFKGYAAWLAQRTAEGLRAPGPADEEAKAELPTFRGSASSAADYAQYLREIEERSVRSLTQFVRGELGLRSMLINSQASFGGLPGLLREAELSDFIDAHGIWSQKDWTQINSHDAGALGRLATYRVFGKPFVVSEYAIAAPSASAAEMFPLLMAIAGLQDWDAVFAFAYADQKREYQPTRINGVFDLAGHPAKLAFLSTAALAFRRGLVAPAQGRVELSVPQQPSPLPWTEDALANLFRAAAPELGVPESALYQPSRAAEEIGKVPRKGERPTIPAPVAALRQIGVSFRTGSGDVIADHPAHLGGAPSSDTGELLWEPDGEHARFTIDAPALKAVCGTVSNSVLEFNDVRFEFGSFAPGFACASLLSLDGTPIASARRLLFSVSGLAQNGRSMQASTPSEVALAQYVPVAVVLPRARWQAAALDAAGAATRSLPVESGAESKIATAYQGAALSYAFTR